MKKKKETFQNTFYNHLSALDRKYLREKHPLINNNIKANGQNSKEKDKQNFKEMYQTTTSNLKEEYKTSNLNVNKFKENNYLPYNKEVLNKRLLEIKDFEQNFSHLNNKTDNLKLNKSINKNTKELDDLNNEKDSNKETFIMRNSKNIDINEVSFYDSKEVYLFPPDIRVDRWLRPFEMVQEIKIHKELSSLYSGFELYKNKQKIREYFMDDIAFRYFPNQNVNDSFFLDYQIRKVISNLEPFFQNSSNKKLNNTIQSISNNPSNKTKEIEEGKDKTNNKDKEKDKVKEKDNDKDNDKEIKKVDGFVFFTLVKVELKNRSEEEVENIYLTLKEDFLEYLDKERLNNGNINTSNIKQLIPSEQTNNKKQAIKETKNKQKINNNYEKENEFLLNKLMTKIQSPYYNLIPGKILYKESYCPSMKWISSIIQSIQDLNIKDINSNKPIFYNIYPQKVDKNDLVLYKDLIVLNNYLESKHSSFEVNANINKLNTTFPVYSTQGVYIVILYFQGERIMIEVNDEFPFDDINSDSIFPTCEAVSSNNPLGDLYPLLITKAVIKVLSPTIKYYENYNFTNDMNIFYMLTGYLAENIMIQSDVFNNYYNYMSVGKEKDKKDEIENYMICVYNYFSRFLSFKNIDTKKYYMFCYNKNKELLESKAPANTYFHRLQEMYNHGELNQATKETSKKSLTKIRLIDPLRRQSSLFSDESLNNFYKYNRQSSRVLVKINEKCKENLDSLKKEDKRKDIVPEQRKTLVNKLSNKLGTIVNEKNRRNTDYLAFKNDNCNSRLKSISKGNQSKSRESSKRNSKSIGKKNEDQYIVLSAMKKETSPTLNIQNSTKSKLKEFFQNHNNNNINNKLLGSNYNTEDGYNKFHSSKNVSKLSENKLSKIAETINQDCVISQLVYSIPEVFHNFDFNLNRLKPMDFSDLRYIIDNVKNDNYKTMNNRQKREYIDKVQESRKIFKEKKQERLNNLKQNGNLLIYSRVKQTLANLNQFNPKCNITGNVEYNDKEIRLASYCVINFWVQPPSDFLTKMLGISLANQFVMDTLEMINVGNMINSKANNEYMSNFGKEVVEMKGNFSHLSHLNRSTVKKGTISSAINSSKVQEINVKKIDSLPEGGKWVQTSELLGKFSNLIKIINPLQYKNNLQVSYLKTNSNIENKIVIGINLHKETTNNLIKRILEEEDQENIRIKEEISLESVNLSANDPNYLVHERGDIGKNIKVPLKVNNKLSSKVNKKEKTKENEKKNLLGNINKDIVCEDEIEYKNLIKNEEETLLVNLISYIEKKKILFENYLIFDIYELETVDVQIINDDKNLNSNNDNNDNSNQKPREDYSCSIKELSNQLSKNNITDIIEYENQITPPKINLIESIKARNDSRYNSNIGLKEENSSSNSESKSKEREVQFKSKNFFKKLKLKKRNEKNKIRLKGLNESREFNFKTSKEYFLVCNFSYIKELESLLKLSSNMNLTKISYTKFVHYFFNYSNFSTKFSLIPDNSLGFYSIGKLHISPYSETNIIDNDYTNNNEIKEINDAHSENSLNKSKLQSRLNTKSLFKSSKGKISFMKSFKLFEGINTVNKEEGKEVQSMFHNSSLEEKSIGDISKLTQKSANTLVFNKKLDRSAKNSIIVSLSIVKQDNLNDEDLRLMNLLLFFNILLINCKTSEIYTIESLEEYSLNVNEEYYVLVEFNINKLNNYFNYDKENCLIPLNESNSLNISKFIFNKYFKSKFIYLEVFTRKKTNYKVIDFPYCFKQKDKISFNPAKTNSIIKDSLHFLKDGHISFLFDITCKLQPKPRTTELRFKNISPEPSKINITKFKDKDKEIKEVESPKKANSRKQSSITPIFNKQLTSNSKILASTNNSTKIENKGLVDSLPNDIKFYNSVVTNSLDQIYNITVSKKPIRNKKNSNNNININNNGKKDNNLIKVKELDSIGYSDQNTIATIDRIISNRSISKKKPQSIGKLSKSIVRGEFSPILTDKFDIMAKDKTVEDFIDNLTYIFELGIPDTHSVKEFKRSIIVHDTFSEKKISESKFDFYKIVNPDLDKAFVNNFVIKIEKYLNDKISQLGNLEVSWEMTVFSSEEIMFSPNMAKEELEKTEIQSWENNEPGRHGLAEKTRMKNLIMNMYDNNEVLEPLEKKELNDYYLTKHLKLKDVNKLVDTNIGNIGGVGNKQTNENKKINSNNKVNTANSTNNINTNELNEIKKEIIIVNDKIGKQRAFKNYFSLNFNNKLDDTTQRLSTCNLELNINKKSNSLYDNNTIIKVGLPNINSLNNYKNENKLNFRIVKNKDKLLSSRSYNFNLLNKQELQEKLNNYNIFNIDSLTKYTETQDSSINTIKNGRYENGNNIQNAISYDIQSLTKPVIKHERYKTKDFNDFTNYSLNPLRATFSSSIFKNILKENNYSNNDHESSNLGALYNQSFFAKNKNKKIVRSESITNREKYFSEEKISTYMKTNSEFFKQPNIGLNENNSQMVKMNITNEFRTSRKDFSNQFSLLSEKRKIINQNIKEFALKKKEDLKIEVISVSKKNTENLVKTKHAKIVMKK